MEKTNLEQMFETLHQKMMENFTEEVVNKEEMPVNSELFSLKEWLSYSKDRQDSIIEFIHITTEVDPNQKIHEKMDAKTTSYMAKKGILKVLKDALCSMK